MRQRHINKLFTFPTATLIPMRKGKKRRRQVDGGMAAVAVTATEIRR